MHLSELFAGIYSHGCIGRAQPFFGNDQSQRQLRPEGRELPLSMGMQHNCVDN